jgi:hypothetical protein
MMMGIELGKASPTALSKDYDGGIKPSKSNLIEILLGFVHRGYPNI